MLTASIVIYKTPINQIYTILKCISDSQCVCKLYVIDNCPTDESRRLLEESICSSIIEYIPHDNTGYGSSHNIALHKAIEIGSNYHVVLNPDIEFDSNVLLQLSLYMEKNQDVVYILPKVTYPNGDLQYLCKLLPTPKDLIFRRFLFKYKMMKSRNDYYALKFSGYDKIMNPPCLSGCFMFLRVSTLCDNDIFFDERYFMYLEDFDLIRRLHRIGKTIYYPFVSIIHNHSKESYKSKKMLKIHIQSAIKYFNKYGWFFDNEREEMNKKILNEIEFLSKENKVFD